MSIKIEDIMIRDVLTSDISESVLSATIKMNEREVGSIIILDGKKPVGILTERDILKRIVVERKDPEKTKVEEVMSTPIISAKPEMSLDDAVKIMILKRVKKLPILKNEKLVGIITLFDVVRLKPITMNILEVYETKEVPKGIEKYVTKIKGKPSEYEKHLKKKIPVD
ncbi:MAG: CBS domain-containing protein [Candidatus Jordarchaeaceae archaeon]